MQCRRDHGGVIFIDLRDREGLTQVSFARKKMRKSPKQAHHLRSEDVIQVDGKVAARVPGTENPKLPPATSSSSPSKLAILNRAERSAVSARRGDSATKICG